MVSASKAGSTIQGVPPLNPRNVLLYVKILLAGESKRYKRLPNSAIGPIEDWPAGKAISCRASELSLVSKRAKPSLVASRMVLSATCTTPFWKNPISFVCSLTKSTSPAALKAKIAFVAGLNVYSMSPTRKIFFSTSPPTCAAKSPTGAAFLIRAILCSLSSCVSILPLSSRVSAS